MKGLRRLWLRHLLRIYLRLISRVLLLDELLKQVEIIHKLLGPRLLLFIEHDVEEGRLLVIALVKAADLHLELLARNAMKVVALELVDVIQAVVLHVALVDCLRLGWRCLDAIAALEDKLDNVFC